MSEAERRKRTEYIKNRKRWMMIISAILCGVFVLACIFGIFRYKLNKASYIDYTERGNVNYTVSLKENDFYDGVIAEENRAYVAALIDCVIADFDYEFAVAAKDVSLEYTYSVDALMLVADKTTGKVLLNIKDNVIPAKTAALSGDHISIDETAIVGFDKYSDLQKRFVEGYGLSTTKSTLQIILTVNMTGACEQFDGDSRHSYNVKLNVPLGEKTVIMNTTTDNLTDHGQILACSKNVAKVVFLVLFIVFASFTLLAAIALVLFARLTINTDITYENCVKKLLRNYKSYIQKISNTFNEDGYHVLYINSFDEMLEIRDTLQLPILMSENTDRTSTKFLIPAAGGLLYSYEIRVGDYDAIYGFAPEEEDGYGAEDGAATDAKSSFGAKIKAFFVCIWNALKTAWRATCAFFKNLFVKKKKEEAEATEETAEAEATEEATEAEEATETAEAEAAEEPEATEEAEAPSEDAPVAETEPEEASETVTPEETK